jgi:hypothetical protein
LQSVNRYLFLVKSCIQDDAGGRKMTSTDSRICALN